MSRFSKRTGWDLEESSYAAAVREARASGRRLYDLTVSNPTRCGFEYDSAAILGALSDPRSMRYDPDPRGLRSARESIGSYYADHGAEVDPDAILLTTSTSESYSFLFRLLCDAGDEVLIASPGYPLFDFLADLDDVVLRSYPIFYDHGWWIDFAELERVITPRTRAIVVVNPNNPTGHWTGSAERDRLEAICQRHRLALIVDEVFLDYPLSSQTVSGPKPDVRSFATGPHPGLTFVLSGLSKICALPQMKAAWIVALGPDHDLREALGRLEVIADTFLSLSAPIQHALPFWLANRTQMQEQVRARCRANLDALEELASEPGSGQRVLDVAAGWSATVVLPWDTDASYAEELVRERSVVVHPGAFYSFAESRRIVVSLIVPEAEFLPGFERLLQSLHPSGSNYLESGSEVRNLTGLRGSLLERGGG